MSSLTFIRTFVLAALLALGCKPSVGSSCDKGEARCIDGKRELICQAGKFIESPCRGPGGCALTDKGTSCDFSGNRPGDLCSSDEEGAATCANDHHLVACHAGLYAFLPCRGEHGCTLADGRAVCDTSAAEQGDACHDENLKACSVDGSQVLVCKQRTMQRFYACRGPAGCTSSAGKLSCDNSIANAGDACDKKLEGQAFACTSDGNDILACRGGAFVHDQRCKAGQKCSSEGGGTKCAAPAK